MRAITVELPLRGSKTRRTASLPILSGVEVFPQTFFADSFTFSEARSGGHILVYLIPGANADAAFGHRLINWVWYVSARAQDLTLLLTDRYGRPHHNSLPEGGATDKSVSELRIRARHEVHPRMAELIEMTPNPFIQTIVDVVVPQTVFGRTCLLGDAAFVVRPHTAGATAKAAREAMLLADCLQESAGDLNSALSRFQSAQLRYGNERGSMSINRILSLSKLSLKDAFALAQSRSSKNGRVRL